MSRSRDLGADADVRKDFLWNSSWRHSHGAWVRLRS